MKVLCFLSLNLSIPLYFHCWKSKEKVSCSNSWLNPFKFICFHYSTTCVLPVNGVSLLSITLDKLHRYIPVPNSVIFTLFHISHPNLIRLLVYEISLYGSDRFVTTCSFSILMFTDWKASVTPSYSNLGKEVSKVFLRCIEIVKSCHNVLLLSPIYALSQKLKNYCIFLQFLLISRALDLIKIQLKYTVVQFVFSSSP